MEKKKGIPKEILNELDISIKKEKHFPVVKPLLETHQVRLPIPKIIRLKLGDKLNDNPTFEVHYDEKKKEIIYRLK